MDAYKRPRMLASIPRFVVKHIIFFVQPWEERMQGAHEQGRLVLLQNLDSKYTSGEVEVMFVAFYMINLFLSLATINVLKSARQKLGGWRGPGALSPQAADYLFINFTM